MCLCLNWEVGTSRESLYYIQKDKNKRGHTKETAGFLHSFFHFLDWVVNNYIQLMISPLN